MGTADMTKGLQTACSVAAATLSRVSKPCCSCEEQHGAASLRAREAEHLVCQKRDPGPRGREGDWLSQPALSHLHMVSTSETSVITVSPGISPMDGTRTLWGEDRKSPRGAQNPPAGQAEPLQTPGVLLEATDGSTRASERTRTPTRCEHVHVFPSTDGGWRGPKARLAVYKGKTNSVLPVDVNGPQEPCSDVWLCARGLPGTRPGRAGRGRSEEADQTAPNKSQTDALRAGWLQQQDT